MATFPDASINIQKVNKTFIFRLDIIVSQPARDFMIE